MFFNDEGSGLRAIANGDDEALCGIYEKYKDDIYRYSLFITKDSQMAEDILQETIIKIKQKAHTYKGGKEKSWIMRIAHNLSVNQIKKSSRKVQTEFLPSKIELQNDKFNEIVELLTDITDRKIVGLRIDGGFKNKEVAEMLGMDHKTVSRRYRAALNTLKTKLK